MIDSVVQLLTEKPLQRAVSAGDIRKRLGEDLERMQTPSDKIVRGGPRLSEEDIIKLIQSDSQYVYLASILYNSLADVLAVRYFDRLIVRPQKYTYRLVVRKGDKEITMATTTVERAGHTDST